jgi:hypothetical protein
MGGWVGDRWVGGSSGNHEIGQLRTDNSLMKL